jgi:hypothetical protein
LVHSFGLEQLDASCTIRQFLNFKKNKKETIPGVRDSPWPVPPAHQPFCKQKPNTCEQTKHATVNGFGADLSGIDEAMLAMATASAIVFVTSCPRIFKKIKQLHQKFAVEPRRQQQNRTWVYALKMSSAQFRSCMLFAMVESSCTRTRTCT